jgi:hypothetical protein
MVPVFPIRKAKRRSNSNTEGPEYSEASPNNAENTLESTEMSNVSAKAPRSVVVR